MAWALVRLLGLETGYPLVPLMAYTPLAAGGALAVALAAAILRRWRAALVALACGALLAALVVPRALGGPDAPGGVQLRVLSSNLRLGEGSPEALADLVRRLRVDVLAVQEADAAAIAGLRAAGIDALLGEHVVRLGAGTSGTGLFSRLPLEPRAPLPGTVNPLAAATATVPGGGTVELLAVHPTAPFNAERVANWEREYDRALPPASNPGPLRVLLGDFNATLDHDALRDLIGTGYVDAADRVGAGLRATWPVGRRLPPPVTIDHVLADERIGVGAFSTHVIPRSDHKAVFALLRLPRTPPP